MVPGAFEIPMVLECILISKKYNAICCVGAVIRGSPPHFDFVSAEVVKRGAILVTRMRTLTYKSI